MPPELHGALRRRGSSPTAIRSCRSCRARRSRALPRRRLVATIPTGPGTASGPTTEHELEVWQPWPDAGIGIVCGAVVAVDIDIADRRAGARARAALPRERLGDTPALRIGRAPKRLLVYRTAAPFTGIKRRRSRCSASASSSSPSPSIPTPAGPTTGRRKPRRHRHRRPAGDRRGAGARVPRRSLCAGAGTPEAGAARRRRTGDPASGAPGDQRGTADAVRAALAFIPNADLDYDSWVRIGLALKGALGDAGSRLFAAWSAQSAKDDPAFTAKTWAGFQPRSSAPAPSTTSPWRTAGSPIRRSCWTAPSG